MGGGKASRKQAPGDSDQSERRTGVYGIFAGQSVMRELKTYGAASMYGNEP